MMPVLFDWTMIFLVPGLLLGMYAQMKLKSTYNTYRTQTTEGHYTGAEVARRMLDDNNLYNIQIEETPGMLTDHYDPRSGVVRLSSEVYHGKTVTALGIAAHEIGHAIQDSQGYSALKLRNAIIPMTQFGSMLYMPLLLLGILMSAPMFIEIGIWLFAGIVFFQLVTLPVEFDASKRAIATLGGENFLTSSELIGAKKVLGAAALTYVAAAVTAILQLLRLVILFGGRSND